MKNILRMHYDINFKMTPWEKSVLQRQQDAEATRTSPLAAKARTLHLHRPSSEPVDMAEALEEDMMLWLLGMCTRPLLPSPMGRGRRGGRYVVVTSRG
jgi:hypothetical protein